MYGPFVNSANGKHGCPGDECNKAPDKLTVLNANALCNVVFHHTWLLVIPRTLDCNDV